ncbi:type III secretion chaperone SycN [Pseudothauera rhizosphaerae]|uniref:Type III secretion chaperone SycN n=1 Tax=Pseudothauera rhizosphaerae TaxID=2565932 RepID=A0A4S4ADX3_9RHOO|nr:type III secretion chaperone SycN [Pseudothauera rhizosphaerae]THF57283.1 type III secretion chaperone SycN [Pseudothauera rhizosphaerae]
MSWIDQTFEEFGRAIGVGPLRTGAGGGLSLRLGADGRLAFQVGEEAVLILLAQPLPPGDGLAAKLKALDLCHSRHGWSLPARAGLTKDGQLVFTLRLPAREFRLPLLEQAYEQLRRLHEQARA